MKQSEALKQEMLRVLQEIEEVAAAAVKNNLGNIMSVSTLTSLVQRLMVLEIREECTHRHEQAMLMLRGVERGKDVLFSCVDTAMNNTRGAVVYPNVHNDGATFGLKTSTSSNCRINETFHGVKWSKHEACDAARRWVNDGVLPQGA